MKRTWTIMSVRDVPGSFECTSRCSVTLLPCLPMTTLGQSSIQVELYCSVSTSGAPTSIPH